MAVIEMKRHYSNALNTLRRSITKNMAQAANASSNW